jgi:hypothetical protein
MSECLGFMQRTRGVAFYHRSQNVNVAFKVMHCMLRSRLCVTMVGGLNFCYYNSKLSRFVDTLSTHF